MTDKPLETIVIYADVGSPVFMEFVHGFKTARRPDEICGAIMAMRNLHYPYQLGIELGHNMYGIQSIYIEWPDLEDVDDVDDPEEVLALDSEVLKFWGRVIDAAEFRTLYRAANEATG